MTLKEVFETYQKSLVKKVDLESLQKRSSIAHKWKLTYRLLVVREALTWRFVELSIQTCTLSEKGMILGSRILVRAVIETVAMLIYMNTKMKNFLEGKLKYFDFDYITMRLIVGTKNRDDFPEAVNVLTLLKSSENKYNGIEKLYQCLCESTHPNYEGICIGHSRTEYEKAETYFGSFWNEMYGNEHDEILEMCLKIFTREYNEEWKDNFEKIEKYLEQHDEEFEEDRRKMEDMTDDLISNMIEKAKKEEAGLGNLAQSTDKQQAKGRHFRS